MPPDVLSIPKIVKALQGDELERPMTPNTRNKEEQKLRALMKSKERREREHAKMPSWTNHNHTSPKGEVRFIKNSEKAGKFVGLETSISAN